MLVADRNGIIAAKRLTAKSYVQDGLIAMWDGIENAGLGVHDDNATVWKDISSNGNDLTLLNGAHFDSNSLVTANRDKLTADANKKFPYNTIEVCAFFDSSRNSSAFVACGNSINTQRLFTINPNSMQTHSGNYQIVFTSSVSSRSTWAASYVSTYGTPYVNGAKATGTFRTNNWDTNFRFGLSGRPGANANWNFVGNYYCVRLYDRALIAEEIAVNYAVDKARFNLIDGGGDL